MTIEKDLRTVLVKVRKVSSSYVITIPKEIVKAYGIEEGMYVKFERIREFPNEIVMLIKIIKQLP